VALFLESNIKREAVLCFTQTTYSKERDRERGAARPSPAKEASAFPWPKPTYQTGFWRQIAWSVFSVPKPALIHPNILRKTHFHPKSAGIRLTGLKFEIFLKLVAYIYIYIYIG
jgi:hypothetical protein